MHRMTFICLILWGMTAIAPQTSADSTERFESGRLTVTVNRLKTDTGVARFALYDSAASYDAGQPKRKASGGITNGVSMWVIDNLPAGDYVVTFYHDINANNRLDRTGPGIPVEPLAFSNNVRPRFGPPRYDRMVFPFSGEEADKRLEAFDMLGRRGRIGVGVGMIVNQNPYERRSPRVVTIPAITYVGSRLSILGTALQVRVGSLGPMDFRGLIRYSFEQFDTKSAHLAGLRSRHDTIMAGTGMRVALPARMQADMAVETDVLDRHGGQRATVDLSRTWRVAGINVTPSTGIEWLSPGTAAHRYGVAASEARDDRPAYRPGAVHSARFGLGAQDTFGEATALIANGSATVLDAAIRDSPIVVRDRLLSVFLAVAYSF